MSNTADDKECCQDILDPLRAKLGEAQADNKALEMMLKQVCEERDALRGQQSVDIALRVKLFELASKYGIPETDTEEGEKITDMIERLAERNTTQVATIAKLRVVRIEQDKELTALRAEVDQLKAVLAGGYDEHLQALADERDALRAEVERLTDAMSWSESKAHEDAAALRVERDALRAKLADHRATWERWRKVADEQQARDTECIERITKHGLTLEQEVLELKAGLNGARTRSVAFEEMLKDSLVERDVLTGRLEGSRGMLAVTEAERDALRAERDRLRTLLDDGKGQSAVSWLFQEGGILLAKVNELTTERDALRAELAEAKKWDVRAESEHSEPEERPYRTHMDL